MIKVLKYAQLSLSSPDALTQGKMNQNMFQCSFPPHAQNTVIERVRKSPVLSLLTQLCPTATPWTGAHQAPLSMGILQARILEWVATSSCRGTFQPGDQTGVSCIAGEFFTS